MANIVITGANRGIGFSLVKSYMTTGDRVYAFCRSPAQATELAQLAASTDGQLTIHLKDEGVCVASVHPGFVQTDMGGPDADITPEESATGIQSVVKALNLDNSGEFFKWNGELHDW